MYINPGEIVSIVPLMPHGTNSTMFTECCQLAICDDQLCCPGCGREVVGHNQPEVDRSRIRWHNATRNWR